MMLEKALFGSETNWTVMEAMKQNDREGIVDAKWGANV